MTSIRMTAAIAAVGSALVMAAGASAAVTPRLEAYTSADSETTLTFSTPASGDDVAKLVMTVPAEYLASYSDIPGAGIGKVTASTQAGKLTGTVVAAAATDPATVNGQPSTLGAAAAACRGTSAPAQAYWMLKLSIGPARQERPRSGHWQADAGREGRQQADGQGQGRQEGGQGHDAPGRALHGHAVAGHRVEGDRDGDGGGTRRQLPHRQVRACAVRQRYDRRLLRGSRAGVHPEVARARA